MGWGGDGDGWYDATTWFTGLIHHSTAWCRSRRFEDAGALRRRLGAIARSVFDARVRLDAADAGAHVEGASRLRLRGRIRVAAASAAAWTDVRHRRRAAVGALRRDRLAARRVVRDLEREMQPPPAPPHRRRRRGPVSSAAALVTPDLAGQSESAREHHAAADLPPTSIVCDDRPRHLRR